MARSLVPASALGMATSWSPIGRVTIASPGLVAYTASISARISPSLRCPAIFLYRSPRPLLTLTLSLSRMALCLAKTSLK